MAGSPQQQQQRQQQQHQRKRSRWADESDDEDNGVKATVRPSKARKHVAAAAAQLPPLPPKPTVKATIAVAPPPVQKVVVAKELARPPPPRPRILGLPEYTIPRPQPMACRSVDEYEKLNRIDEGAYGIVYRARCRTTGAIVALKKFKLDAERHGFPVTALRELTALMRTRAHPNIVHLREVVVGSSLTSVFAVMDFAPHDLKALLASMPDPGFRASEVKALLYQLLSAAADLHARWLVHRDLKTSNLLLTDGGVLKVADFGLIRQFSDASGVDGEPGPPDSGDKALTLLVITLWYRAPELLLGAEQYGAAVDVWSIGCIFAELCTRKPLFPGRGELDQLDRVARVLGGQLPDRLRALPHASKLNLSRHGRGEGLRSVVSGLSDLGHELLAKLLDYDPARRITAQEALGHAYFREHPLAKDPSLFPSFPSKANGETKVRDSPSAPVAGHGGLGPGSDADGVVFSSLFADAAFADERSLAGQSETGFSLRMGGGRP
ncbi:kinase-like domain-containing protein [Blastocladiella britannica]|nr:kinase-like domain-containing protein [Blastocladiella britannica]